jgi:hypothetical protein
VIEPELETRRPATGPAFGDAVTFAFADPAREIYGMARLGIGAGKASAIAVLMQGRDAIGAVAEGGLDVPDGAEWIDFGAAGVRATVEAPLEAWAVAYDGDGHGFALTFQAVSPPGATAAVEGMDGYEQLCLVTGTVRIGTETVEVDGLGQRGHEWGAPDWDAVALTRTVSAWLFDDDLSGITLTAARPSGASAHDGERVLAVLVEGGEALPVFDPRLSTTYDGDGHTRRAGLELWVTEDGYPLRAAGEVVCGTSLDLGALSLDLAFLRWSAEGREGIGRYEILRRR